MLLLTGGLIGLMPRLTGAGGSVFAVPLLVLLAEMPMNDAIEYPVGRASNNGSGVSKNGRRPNAIHPAAFFTLRPSTRLR